MLELFNTAVLAAFETVLNPTKIAKGYEEVVKAAEKAK